MSCCDIWETFGERDNLIKEYTHWELLLGYKKATLGYCVAVVKRHLEELSAILPKEMEEFSSVVKDVEKSLKESFQNDHINYFVLMRKEKHVHFHIMPRYASRRSFAGLEWEDSAWPHVFTDKARPGEPLTPEVLQQVKGEIQKHL